MRAIVACVLVAVASATATSFCDHAEWHTVWSDEFDGVVLEDKNWNIPVHGPGGSDTRDASATLANVFVQNGTLVLRTDGHWNGSAWTNLTSGAVQSNGKAAFQAAGTPTRVCVMAKLPGGAGGGRGLWPAHWMMPDTKDCWPCAGEIDILEMINGDGFARGTYHWSRTNTSGDNQQSFGEHPMPKGWADEWHEYSAEYDGRSLVHFAVDDVIYASVTPSTRSLPGLQRAAFFDVPYYIILNTAIGGGWPQPPDSSTHLPAYHYVDYVRVARPNDGSVQ
jgi:beta-glucanase (GH16 family)